MSCNLGPSISSSANSSGSGLVAVYDGAGVLRQSQRLHYRVFSTNGTNPTTAAGFSAFFDASPVAFGIHTGNIDWSTVSVRPAYIIATTAFAWEVSGKIQIPQNGYYEFNIASDDGNELAINGNIVASFYGGRGIGAGDFSAPILLKQGLNDFRYRMQQGAGGAGARASWKKPGDSVFSVIPATSFFIRNSENMFNGADKSLASVGTIAGGALNMPSGNYLFNGSTSYVSLNIPITPATSYSIVQWIRPAVALTDTLLITGTGRKTPLVGPGPVWNPGYWLTARNFRVHAATEYRDVTIDWVNDTSWHQVGQIFNGTTCWTIIDGEIILGTRTGYSPGTPTTLYFGAETSVGNAQNWNGEIGNTLFYNRVIAASEVKYLYNTFKLRYTV